MLYHDLKGLQMGLFVLFLDLLRVLNRLQVVEYGSKGLKIGKRVMCRDFKPNNDRPMVISFHLEPAENRLKATGACFRCDVLNDGFSCLAFLMRLLRKAGLVPCGNLLCGDGLCRFKITYYLTFKLLEQ
jgi:hypothetical protein